MIPKWTSVKTGLPIFNKKYIISWINHTGEYVGTGVFYPDSEKWAGIDGKELPGAVTHWTEMPMKPNVGG